MQDRDACNEDCRKCHGSAAERDHPQRGGQHQPGQRLEEADRSERNLREGLLELLPKRCCHRATMPAGTKPSVVAVNKIASKIDPGKRSEKKTAAIPPARW